MSGINVGPLGWEANQDRLKIHLGCGRLYLEGYVNVDYPPKDHTVQSDLRADVYCDLTTLTYPRDSVAEIRLHHVFEHFPRPTAIALLCRWRDWLASGGVLRIETPDMLSSCWLLASPLISYGAKQEIIRHLFGSHESHWAVHWDGWYKARFVRTLQHLGFEAFQVSRTKWGWLRNVEVVARKSPERFSVDQYRDAARTLLNDSTVKLPRGHGKGGMSSSEHQLLEVWLRNWEGVYLGSS